ncbi:hypothetical protein [Enorma phocaeensis]|uniref:DUF1837 domain-containing protein n=1 Tax=Enorma phocaeensis TaxID=1871019 RepID=A0ABT7VBA2_9ACTN|nr:hypothetical protein [Enorma phocaeensis]MDM8275761.1 hypothetical protein [Enorma phocaeensis]
MDRPDLLMQRLPPSTIVSGFVSGIKVGNYEAYLRELLNNSSHFMKLGGSPFVAPESEDRGQCDAISQHYELDFKLLVSQTEMQAASILTPQPFVEAAGVTFFAECKNPDGRITVTRIHAALRGLSMNELENTRLGLAEKSLASKDIAQILAVSEVKKNVLFLFPYDLSFNNPIKRTDAVKIIGDALAGDFGNLFLYRNKHAAGFDTFLTVKHLNEFLVFRGEQDWLKFIEPIPVSKMPAYAALNQYGSMWS